MVLFEGKLTGEAAYHGLADAGYMTRWLPGQGLGHGVRITVGTAAAMDAVAARLRTMAEAAQ
jgi:histidinol-phosphate aminotransferase